MGRVSHRGFTLIESVTALAIASVILAALGSVLAMSLKAFPRPESDPSADAAALQDAEVWLKDDLGSATSIVSSSATMLEFRVADRDRDSQPETIRYWWSGGGERLTRTINGSDETTFGPVLSDLAFSPWWRDVPVKTATAATMGADEVLFRFPGTSNATQSIGSTLLAVTFTPVLQADATAFNIKSCQIWYSSSLVAVVTLRARLYAGTVTNLGAQTALASANVASVSAGATNVPLTMTFSTTPEIAAGQQLTIVFDATISVGTLTVNYNTSGVPSSTMSASTGSGSTWTAYPAGGAPIWIVGAQKRPGTSTTNESRLFGVGVVATPKRSGAMPARFAIGTPTEPKVQ